jgi:phosphopantothenate synthetase
VKNTVKKIYEFIIKLVSLLENELTELQNGSIKNTISTQKNITDILNKLVNLISQLNKISKENNSSLKRDFSKSDKEILSKYIEKIKLEMKSKNGK